MNPYQILLAVVLERGRPVRVFAVLVDEGEHRRAWFFERLTTAQDAATAFGLFGHALLDEHGMS